MSTNKTKEHDDPTLEETGRLEKRALTLSHMLTLYATPDEVRRAQRLANQYARDLVAALEPMVREALAVPTPKGPAKASEDAPEPECTSTPKGTPETAQPTLSDRPVLLDGSDGMGPDHPDFRNAPAFSLSEEEHNKHTCPAMIEGVKIGITNPHGHTMRSTKPEDRLRHAATMAALAALREQEPST